MMGVSIIAHDKIFRHNAIRRSEYQRLIKQFLSVLPGHIGRVSAKFRAQGPEFAYTLIAAILNFGTSKSFPIRALRAQEGKVRAGLEALQILSESGQRFEDLGFKRENMLS